MNGAADQLGSVVGAHSIIFVAHDTRRLVLRLFLADALEVGAELGSESVETAPAGGSVGGRAGGGVQASGLVR